MFWLAKKHSCHVVTSISIYTRRFWHFGIRIRIHLGSFRHITLPQQNVNILRPATLPLLNLSGRVTWESPTTAGCTACEAPKSVSGALAEAKCQTCASTYWFARSSMIQLYHLKMLYQFISYHMMLYPVQLTIRCLILVDGGCTLYYIIILYYIILYFIILYYIYSRIHVSTRSVWPLVRLS